jgi:hypothetical protein
VPLADAGLAEVLIWMTCGTHGSHVYFHFDAAEICPRRLDMRYAGQLEASKGVSEWDAGRVSGR